MPFEKIQKAIIDLYDSYSRIPEDSRAFIEAVYKQEDLYALFLKAAKAKKTRTVPLAYGSLTKEQFDKEIEKGMADVKAGRVY